MKLGKPLVCVNVFPSLDAIEIIKLEEKGGEIEKTASLPAFFNQATRNIDDVSLMSQTIQDLYTTNRIPLTTPTVLVLPSYFTREIELPAEFSKDEIQVGLISEAERFYIFKKSEPQIDWIKLNETTLLYSAFPKTELEKFIQIFNTLKIPLLAIDLNYFSIFRGLIATGAISEELEYNYQWGLLNVTDFAFFSMTCEGTRIINSMEAPISFSTEDDLSTIQEIQQDLERFIEGSLLRKFIVVNNSARLSTDHLMSALSFLPQSIVIEQCEETLRSRGTPDAQFPCSLEAIGGVFYYEFPELPSINFASNNSEEALTVLHYQSLAIKGLVGLNIAALFVGACIWIVMSLLLWIKNNDLEDIKQHIASIQSAHSGGDFREIQEKLFLKKKVDQNIAMNDAMVNMGAKLPREMWIDKIRYSVDPAINSPVIDIEGGSLMPESVNQFYNELSKSPGISPIEIGKAELTNSPDGQSFYQWVIQSKTKENKPLDQASGSRP